MNHKTLHWQWVTYLNYQRLGCSEDKVGCILLDFHSLNGEKKVHLLSHDDELDTFFAAHGISPALAGGTIVTHMSDSFHSIQAVSCSKSKILDNEGG